MPECFDSDGKDSLGNLLPECEVMNSSERSSNCNNDPDKCGQSDTSAGGSAGNFDNEPIGSTGINRDIYGNRITEDGLYDSTGKWHDTTDFNVDPEKKDAVDKAVRNTAGRSKMGSNAAENDEYNYNEAIAAELGNFDINDWLVKKGLTGQFEESNNRMLLYSLEDSYLMPK